MTLLISHIPKTAGTSLRRIVEERDPLATFVYDGELALGNPNLDFLKTFRSAVPPATVIGHFSYGVHRLLGVPPRYVTVLRQPIARVASLYYHQRSLPHSRFTEQLAAGMTLTEFVESGITEMTNNHMCRCIAGIAPDAGNVINDRWLLDLALHNLRRHYLLVGRQEDFPNFVKALGALQGWPDVSVPTLNTAEHRTPELDARTWALILAHNALDHELYESAASLTP